MSSFFNGLKTYGKKTQFKIFKGYIDFLLTLSIKNQLKVLLAGVIFSSLLSGMYVLITLLLSLPFLEKSLPNKTNNVNSPVIIYKDCGYGGKQTIFDIGDYNLRGILGKGLQNNDASSVKIQSGYQVTFYQNDNFQGYSWTLTSDDDCFTNNQGGRGDSKSWNDDITSLKIQKLTSGIETCLAIGDNDGDSICDDEDNCPSLNNNLIGTECDDGNPNTSLDIWQSDCTCAGIIIGAQPKEVCGAGIYGGGPFYYTDYAINEVKKSGFNWAVIWTIHIMNKDGDLNFNAEFPLISNGEYVGYKHYPNFKHDVALLETAPTSIQYTEFGLAAWNSSTFGYIRDLVNSEGTGPGTKLYKNFKKLRETFPTVDAISFDDENYYHESSTTRFAIMLADLGFKVSIAPYTKIGHWKAVVNNVNSARPGTIDNVHLQIYAGGANNDYCSWKSAFPNNIKVLPGIEDGNNINSKMRYWNNQCGIEGGWLWLYDDFDNNLSLVQRYAAAINDVVVCNFPVDNRIQAKVYLEGFYDGNHGLVKNENHYKLLPKEQPFGKTPWNYNGHESVNAFPPNTIDWIFLTTRDADGNIQEQTVGFINTSGELIGIDGEIGIPVNNSNSYFSIHHKSHLAVMSSTVYTGEVYDFTTDINKAMGSEQLQMQGGSYMMYSGDYDGNGIINALDYNEWKQNSATINQYLNIDGDGNGIINGLDYNLWTRNRSKIGHLPLQY